MEQYWNFNDDSKLTLLENNLFCFMNKFSITKNHFRTIVLNIISIIQLYIIII